ncbi:Hypothetical predicted protein [Lynx pardinus]|uniref:Uncharacterized protein n=1 Tax=Lynx pardinus TaxID=191816 RepID=A0A485NUG5_LYNPA|nr:Hypothetical predicted protein [Lynx pardinus]
MGLACGRTPALRCACALVLVCLLPLLLLRPRGALGEELRLPQPPGPRAADWLSNLAHFNKYLEKLFNSRWAGWGERAGGRTEGVGVGEETDATRTPTHRSWPPRDLCKDVCSPA